MIWVYDPHRQAAVGVELYWEILTDFNLNFHLRSPQPCLLYNRKFYYHRR